MARSINESGQWPDAARGAFEQQIPVLGQHASFLVGQHDSLLQRLEQLPPLRAVFWGVDIETSQYQGCVTSPTLSEDAVDVVAVAVETALFETDSDEDDGQRKLIADVFELVADLDAGGALLRKCKSSTMRSFVSHDSTQSMARVAKSAAVPLLVPAWL